MSVRRKPDGRWFFLKWVRFPDGHRERVFGTPREFGLPNTKAAAHEAMTRKIAAILQGQPVRVAPPAPPSSEALRGFWPTFLEHSEARNEDSSIDSKKQIWKTHLEPHLGDLPLRAITFAVIEDFKHAIMKPKGKLGAKTTTNVLTVLRALLVLAHKRQLIDAVPAFEWPKVPKAAFDFLSFEEADALIAGAEEDWRTMIVVALRTGMRQSELLGLKWDAVDLVAGRVHVREARVRGRTKAPKNDRPREIPLSDHAHAALKAHRHLRGPFVFCDLDGRPLTKGACKHPLWRACKAAGLRRIGWHVPRHTFASHLAMRGVPLKAIQELMGHGTIQMTMRYAHLSPEVARDAVRMLDAGAQPVPNERSAAPTSANSTARAPRRTV